MKRALLIEASSPRRTACAEYLQARGVDTYTARGLSDARALLPALKPDVTALDPDLEDGDILVARGTDPSWASVMFLASGLITDIGGTRVYVQDTGSGAMGVRASDGKLLWTFDIDKTTAVIPTPIVRGDLVFFVAGYGRGGDIPAPLG